MMDCWRPRDTKIWIIKATKGSSKKIHEFSVSAGSEKDARMQAFNGGWTVKSIECHDEPSRKSHHQRRP